MLLIKENTCNSQSNCLVLGGFLTDSTVTIQIKEGAFPSKGVNCPEEKK